MSGKAVANVFAHIADGTEGYRPMALTLERTRCSLASLIGWLTPPAAVVSVAGLKQAPFG